ncbi:MAG: proton-conducting transporter membrane subunit [Caldilineaceae bacterium]
MLIVLAAVLKSAMFPFHGWLLEVMETPTPVSALLHARSAQRRHFPGRTPGEPVILSAPALQMLMLVGGFTALFASTAMITQSSVKVSLAYSSAAHMGFMLMLCGLGAHSVAIMHLVAHSFYKAHAFLSAGSVVEYTGAFGGQKFQAKPRPLTMAASLPAALLMYVTVGTLAGIDLTAKPGEMALGDLRHGRDLPIGASVQRRATASSSRVPCWPPAPSPWRSLRWNSWPRGSWPTPWPTSPSPTRPPWR